MSKFSYTVNAVWDPEASVWVATSEDVPGLVAEASSIEELSEKLKILVPELLELNEHLLDRETPPVIETPQILLTAQRELQIA